MGFKMSEYGFINNCKMSYVENGISVVFKWYKSWSYMIHRCYNPSDVSYKNYGAKGVYIEDFLKISSNYRDFYELNNPNGVLVPDKDKSGKRYYGVDTIQFITRSENSREAILRRGSECITGANNYRATSMAYWGYKSYAERIF